MRTRREQVQAYRFLTRRIVSALLSGEPETTERPMRRLGLAVFSSTMVAAIVLAGIGVYGFIRPSGGRPDDNSIVIERETGARYVFLGGRLYPVLNYASARLVVAGPDPVTKTFSRRSLRDLPRGEPVGIADAPDALPEAGSLVGLPWSTCGLRRAPGSTTLVTQLLVGRVPSGGGQLGDQALLVSVGTGAGATWYLLWNGHRLRIPDRSTLAALDLTAATPVPVGLPLLNSVPAGPDLTVPDLPDRGEPGPTVGATPGALGQVYRSGAQDYVLVRSGLAPIGAVMARLLLAGGGQVVEISASDAGAAPRATGFEPEDFPTRLPVLYRSGDEPGTICVTYRQGPSPAEGVTTIDVYDQPVADLAEAATQMPSVPRSVDGIRLADRVAVPGGRGALVRVLPAPGASTELTTTYLVTDRGIKYALPTGAGGAADVRSVLGYALVTPALIPAQLLALVPTGPALDPGLARQFATGPSASPSPG
jgi:type VII secretion protein EccB